MHAAVTIVKQDGPLGLWAGAAPTVMRNGTNQMCLFWAKNNFDRLFFGKIEGDGRQLHPWQSMLSGFSAACIGPCATGPFDVVKVRATGLIRLQTFSPLKVALPTAELSMLLGLHAWRLAERQHVQCMRMSRAWSPGMKLREVQEGVCVRGCTHSR